MKKFINTYTGVILEPRSEMVEQQLAKSSEWQEYVEKKPEKAKSKK